MVCCRIVPSVLLVLGPRAGCPLSGSWGELGGPFRGWGQPEPWSLSEGGGVTVFSDPPGFGASAHWAPDTRMGLGYGASLCVGAHQALSLSALGFWIP